MTTRLENAEIGCTVAVGIVFLAGLWLFWVFRFPYQKISSPTEIVQTHKSRIAVTKVLKEWLVTNQNNTKQTNADLMMALLENMYGYEASKTSNSPASSPTSGITSASGCTETQIALYPPGSDSSGQTPSKTGQSPDRTIMYDEFGNERSFPSSDVAAALCSGYFLTKPNQRQPQSQAKAPETPSQPVEEAPSIGSSVLRIDARGGGNVVIYLRQKDVELIPYPDRAAFFRSVEKAWCDNLPEGQFFLPSVYIEDIRTGTEWARYNCLLN